MVVQVVVAVFAEDCWILRLFLFVALAMPNIVISKGVAISHARHTLTLVCSQRGHVWNS